MTDTAFVTVKLEARTRGAWRLRLVSWLLVHRVYVAGMTAWALSGVRLETRTDGGPWVPAPGMAVSVRESIDVEFGE